MYVCCIFSSAAALHVAASRASVITSRLTTKRLHSLTCACVPEHKNNTNSSSRVQLCRRCMCKNTSGVESHWSIQVTFFSSQLRPFRQDDPVNIQRTHVFSHKHKQCAHTKPWCYTILMYCFICLTVLCCQMVCVCQKGALCTVLNFGIFFTGFQNVSKEQKVASVPKNKNPYP